MQNKHILEKVQVLQLSSVELGRRRSNKIWGNTSGVAKRNRGQILLRCHISSYRHADVTHRIWSVDERLQMNELLLQVTKVPWVPLDINVNHR